MHWAISFSLSSFLAAIYWAYILFLKKGVENCLGNHSHTLIPHKKLSIVIAMRNEAENLPQLIKALEQQSYDADNWELIIVDDHSDDGSFSVAEKLTSNLKNRTILQAPTMSHGKKQAIQFGMKHTKHPVCVWSDADCSFHHDWLFHIAQHFTKKKGVLAGPVLFKYQNSNIFSKLLELEFFSLVAAGAGAIGRQRAIFCNAANLAFDRELYDAEKLRPEISSGDDVFLLHEAKAKKLPIHFHFDQSCTVTTQGPETLSAFLRQRIRWASKTKHYADKDAIITGAFIFMINITILSLAIVSSFDDNIFLYLVILFSSKYIADYIFMKQALKAVNKEKLNRYSILLSLIYPIYSVIVAICSIFAKPYWKGRRIK